MTRTSFKNNSSSTEFRINITLLNKIEMYFKKIDNKFGPNIHYHLKSNEESFDFKSNLEGLVEKVNSINKNGHITYISAFLKEKFFMKASFIKNTLKLRAEDKKLFEELNKLWEQTEFTTDLNKDFIINSVISEGKNFLLALYQKIKQHIDNIEEKYTDKLLTLKYLPEIDLQIILKYYVKALKKRTLKVKGQNYYPLLARLFLCSLINSNGYLEQGIKIILENRDNKGLLKSSKRIELCNAIMVLILYQNGFYDELVENSINYLKKSLEKGNLDIITEFSTLESLQLINKVNKKIVDNVYQKYIKVYDVERLEIKEKHNLFFLNYLLKLILLKINFSGINKVNLKTINDIIEFIILQRNLDCGWGISKKGPSDFFLTILILHNLTRFRSILHP